MKKVEKLTIQRLKACCLGLRDPRRQSGNFKYALMDILIIVILGVISGSEGWEEIYEYALCKEAWLRGFLELKRGIPKPDVYRRVMSALNPSALEKIYRDWVSEYVGSCVHKQIGIDGKMLRGTGKSGWESDRLHMVSAWVREDGISLGQIRTAEKSNEITAIPELLDSLNIAGAAVTIDAMGCQKVIAEKIVERQANYILCVKGNQRTLTEDIADYFSWAQTDKHERQHLDEHIEIEKGHGRIVTRRTVITHEVSWCTWRPDWKNLSTLIMVERKVIFRNEESRQRVYYISDLVGNAEAFGHMIRGHWSIENQLHWMLDVSFREDDSLIHAGFAAQNLSLVRKIALACLKRDKSKKVGIKAKQKIAGWDNRPFAKLMNEFEIADTGDKIEPEAEALSAVSIPVS